MFAAQGFCQFVHIAVQKVHEFHHHARAALWVDLFPSHLCFCCNFNSLGHFVGAGQWDFGLDFARCRVVDICETTRCAFDVFAANVMG